MISVVPSQTTAQLALVTSTAVLFSF